MGTFIKDVSFRHGQIQNSEIQNSETMSTSTIYMGKEFQCTRANEAPCRDSGLTSEMNSPSKEDAA